MREGEDELMVCFPSVDNFGCHGFPRRKWISASD